MGGFRKGGAGSISRLTWALVTFIGVAAIAGGVGALDNITLDGPATLEQLTRDVIAACPGATGLSYQGKWNFTTSPTPYEAGEADLLQEEQTIAPMGKTFGDGPLRTSLVCAYPRAAPATQKDASKAEGLLVGFDVPVFVASQSVASSCNAGAADCNPTTDPGSGLARSRQIALPGGGTYTYRDWTDVLRIVLAGMKQGDGSDLDKRDCNSIVRQTIVNNWGNLFQTNCSGGSCTQLQHVFRLSDTSDTTEVLLALLNLPYLDSVQGASNGPARSPFCNAVYAITSGPRIIPDFEDNDPIRRPCIGNGNIPLPPNTTPPTQPTEQVCGRYGTLGLVLPIQPPPPRASETPLPYPTTLCARGKFVFGAAPRINGTTYDRCPNGDVPVFGGQCFVPADANENPQCLNGKANLPLFKIDASAADATDGRVYNLHLRKSDGSYQTIRRPGLIAGQLAEQQISGAFYRIHQTRTALPAPSTTGTCAESDPSRQIGCLVAANPCSVGTIGAGATDFAGSVRLKLNGSDATAACVRNSLNGGLSYPIIRKLSLNTLLGFENVTGQERALASCFTNQALMGPILSARGFVSLGTSSRCEDFNESAFCGAVPNRNACSNNTGVGLPSNTAYCGNGTVDIGEECDDGNFLVSAPADRCSAGCTTCGNALVSYPETCDASSSSCTSQCGLPRSSPCTQIGTGAPLDIDDHDACTSDRCDPLSGIVLHTHVNSGPCGHTCKDDSSCSLGERCMEDAGQRFGLPADTDVCLNPACLSDPTGTGCGPLPSTCGSCVCIPNCAEKVCGDNPADGCGGFCRGLCQVGESGCTRTEQCPNHAVCQDGDCV